MPTKPLIFAALLIIISTAAIGCYSPHIYSPAGRVALLETAKTVGHEQRSVGVQAGRSAVMDFYTDHLTARARYGLSDYFEVGADASFQRYANMPSAPSRTNPTLWSARLAAKWAPEDFNDYAAVIGGVGGGTYAGGEFISPDLGLVFALENPYVVPFLTLSAHLSVPLNPQAVDIGVSEMSDYFSTPTTTFGFTATTGLRVPIKVGTWTVAPTVGVTLTKLSDESRDDSGVALNAGIDTVF